MNQNGASVVVLEFTESQLKISGTGEAAVYYAKETYGKIEIGTSSGVFTQDFCTSYEITSGTLAFTDGTSATSYPSAIFYKANALSSGQWKDGEITSDSQGQVWYSFNVTGGTTYRVWWNDGYEGILSTGGNGTKSLDISVSGYDSGGTVISGFNNTDTAWSTARSFTPTASGIAYLKVTPYTPGRIGTFGIVYSTETERPNVPFNLPSATPLTINEWKDGEITTGSNGEVWYSFPVAIGTVYNVWWNESGSNGNDTKTLNVSVRGFYSDGDTITGFSTTATAWSTAKFFTPTKGGTVYLRVTPGTSGETGTFGIVYNTGLNADRPGLAFNPPNPAPLIADEWKDGAITSGSNGVAWHSLTVTAETPYYFWWNESDYNGNGLKSLNVSVSALDSDGNVISGFSTTTTAWTTAKSYTPTVSGTIYLKVVPGTLGQTGTYGIVYSETNTRPAAPFTIPNAIPLTADIWANGEITSASNGEAWYSFTVANGTTYSLWWNDYYSGNGLFKTLNVRVSAWYGSIGNNIFYDIDTAWSSPQTIAPTADGTVYVRVYPSSSASNNTGTFGIVYSATNTRPPVPFGPNEPPNPITLTAGVWEDGAISNSANVDWYSIDVTSENTYYVWWNDGSGYATGGNGLYTMDVYVYAYYRDGTSIFSEMDDAWNSPRSFSPTANSTVYFRVTSRYSSTGTYSIVYSQTNTRPVVPINPLNPIALTADQWTDGEIAIAGGVAWYSFPVTEGTIYYIWWNDYDAGNDTKTLDVRVSGFYGDSDGTSIFASYDNGWTNQTPSFTASSNNTVYLHVRAVGFGSGTGTFGIVYSTTNTRPAIAP